MSEAKASGPRIRPKGTTDNALEEGSDKPHAIGTSRVLGELLQAQDASMRTKKHRKEHTLPQCLQDSSRATVHLGPGMRHMAKAMSENAERAAEYEEQMRTGKGSNYFPQRREPFAAEQYPSGYRVRGEGESEQRQMDAVTDVRKTLEAASEAQAVHYQQRFSSAPSYVQYPPVPSPVPMFQQPIIQTGWPGAVPMAAPAMPPYYQDPATLIRHTEERFQSMAEELRQANARQAQELLHMKAALREQEAKPTVPTPMPASSSNGDVNTKIDTLAAGLEQMHNKSQRLDTVVQELSVQQQDAVKATEESVGSIRSMVENMLGMIQGIASTQTVLTNKVAAPTWNQRSMVLIRCNAIAFLSVGAAE